MTLCVREPGFIQVQQSRSLVRVTPSNWMEHIDYMDWLAETKEDVAHSFDWISTREMMMC